MMKTVLVFLSMIILADLGAVAQTPASSQQSPKAVMEQFCKLEAEGKEISPDGGQGLVSLLHKQKLWARQGEIVVATKYLVHGPDLQEDSAQFVVDYHVWGRLDVSLRFARLEGRAANEPIRVREYFRVVRSDTRLVLESDGQWREVKSAPEWMIDTIPSTPHVSIDAAIHYVTQLGDKSNDPIIKENAQRTLVDLRALLDSQSPKAAAAQQTPVTVLSEFCAQETGGAGLTPKGWKSLDAFFVRPRTDRGGNIHVAKDFVVSNATIEGSGADLYVEYTELGVLDPSFRFTNNDRGPIKVREAYKLALENGDPQPEYGKEADKKEAHRPRKWRIEGSPTEQWITLDTAMRFLRAVGDSANDEATKNNVSKSVVLLNRYRTPAEKRPND